MAQSGQVRLKVQPGVKFAGTVVDWNKTIGFIKADKAVNHPEASKRGGKILCLLKDIVGKPDQIRKGAKVEFFCYFDKGGLGAEHVRVLGSPHPPAQAPAAKPGAISGGPITPGAVSSATIKPGAISPGAPLKPGVIAAATTAAASSGGSRGPGFTPAMPKYKAPAAKADAKPAGPIPKAMPQKASSAQPQQQGVGGSAKGVIKTIGKQQQQQAAKSKGLITPTLAASSKGEEPKPARERISDQRFKGRINKWFDDRIGWIEPEKAIDHPLATKHKGQVHAKSEDAVPGVALKQDAHVDFLVCIGTNGLCAEKIRLISQPIAEKQKGSIGPGGKAAATPPKAGGIPAFKPAVPKAWSPGGKGATSPAGKDKGASKGTSIQGKLAPWKLSKLSRQKKEVVEEEDDDEEWSMDTKQKKPAISSSSAIAGKAGKLGKGGGKGKGASNSAPTSVIKAIIKPIIKPKISAPANAFAKGVGKGAQAEKGMQAKIVAKAGAAKGGSFQALKAKIHEKHVAQAAAKVGGAAKVGRIPQPGERIAGKGSKSGKGSKGGKSGQPASKPLPPNWEEHRSDEHGVPYFWNKVTKESLWVRPK